MCLFFKQKTAYEMRISDWSSDVCSSDLLGVLLVQHVVLEGVRWQLALLYMAVAMQACGMTQTAAIVVIIVDVLLTLGLCFLFPFTFPLKHQGPFKVGSVDLYLRPIERSEARMVGSECDTSW